MDTIFNNSENSKISAPHRLLFNLSDKPNLKISITWCFVSDIHDYFEYIIKNGLFTDNPPIRIYVNKIENRIIFKIKTGFYLELLTSETMKFLGNTKNKITKDENGENVSNLVIRIL